MLAYMGKVPLYIERHMKHNLTPNEETTIRLVHHDHGGESVQDAAVYMGCTVKAVQRLLRNVERKAPQLFPILLPQHRAILAMRDQHISYSAMIVGLGITKKKLKTMIAFLREHRFLWNKTTDQYQPSMDGEAKTKF